MSWDAADGTRIKLVDTPGFDDSREGITDAEVLKMIATFLAKELVIYFLVGFLTHPFRYGENSQLTGLIYVHRISDTRVGGTSKRNLRMFRKLCGTESLKNVVIVTTMWDKVTPEEGSQREQELMSSKTLFKPLLDGGATMMRHEKSTKTADIINYLLGKNSTTTQIVHELVKEQKTLKETEAGSELHSDIQALLKKQREEMETFKAEMMGMAERVLAEERRKMDERMAKLLKELDELKRGITTPFPRYVSSIGISRTI